MLRGLAVLWMLVAALPAEARDLGLAEATRQSQAIVLARVGDPPTSTTEVRKGQGEPYQRYRRHLTVLQSVVGKLRGALAVDEPHWREQAAAHPKPVEVDDYRGTLTREPRPGDVVLVFLVRNPQGEWELVADHAMDAAALKSEVLRVRKGGAR